VIGRELGTLGRISDRLAGNNDIDRNDFQFRSMRFAGGPGPEGGDMLRKEDSRRLAQLERQLWRDDPEFCARMTAGHPSRRHVSLTLIFAAMAIWTAALVLGVVGLWIPAAGTAVCATAVVVAVAYRSRPSRRHEPPGPMPPAW
jgi:DUF3040 family protein